MLTTRDLTIKVNRMHDPKEIRRMRAIVNRPMRFRDGSWGITLPAFKVWRATHYRMRYLANYSKKR